MTDPLASMFTLLLQAIVTDQYLKIVFPKQVPQAIKGIANIKAPGEKRHS